MNNRLIKSNDAGGGACTNTVDLYNPFPDGGGVALYQLNGDATDVSGNYNGTATNVTYGAGQFGQSGVFNGSSSYINTSLNFATTAKTVSLWFKIPNTGVYGTVISSNNNGTGDPLLAAYNWHGLQFNSSGNVLTFSVLTGNWERVSTTTSNFSVDTWYNVTVTNDATSLKIYLNGVLENTTTLTGTINTGAPLIEIGGNTNTGGTTPVYFNGSIDQVRIFNRALRPYEVEALYTEEYCTPTIVPSEHFNTVLYTGTGATNPVTGVGFQPDFVWLKKRSGVDDHFVFDSIRGAKSIYPNLTNAEDSFTFSFDTDGFTVPVSGGTNGNGDTFVAWNFKAGGAAVTNTDGTITSQVSANTEAGFSIVTFTGNGSTASVGHGLGQKPSIIFTKNRSASEGWFTQQYMYVPSGNAAYGYLNTTAAFTGFTDSLTNDTVMQQGGTNGQNYVTYCFAEVEGFSSFGSYVGNGSTSGPTVITGFEPAFLLIKQSSASGEYWNIWDNKRSPENPRSDVLFPNLSNAESSNQSWSDVQFLENGFQVTPTVMTPTNQSGATYIYMAFAADPTAVEPTLEDSFNTVLWTGDGTSNRQITGVNFQPDLVWTKGRNNASWAHFLQDSVRGATKFLKSNTTDAEGTTSPNLVESFDTDGFTINANGNTNNSGDTYVAWNWKAAEIPAINSNGSIPSVVSANPAAGFSIVSYTGNGGDNQTIGHGLGITPSIVITKNRNKSGGLDGQWAAAFIPNSISGYLNTTNAFETPRFNVMFGSGTNSNTFTVSTGGTFGHTNENGDAIIAYCFAEVAGFSKFGSYTGNGLPLGPSIDLGFEPAFVMIKRTTSDTSGGNWIMLDNKRDTTNPNTKNLFANLSNAETDEYGVDFLSNGFQIKSSDTDLNKLNGEYIYMAFANQF